MLHVQSMWGWCIEPWAMQEPCHFINLTSFSCTYVNVPPSLPPLPQGYDISFLITNFHTEQMYKHKLVDFVIHVSPLSAQSSSHVLFCFAHIVFFCHVVLLEGIMIKVINQVILQLIWIAGLACNVLLVWTERWSISACTVWLGLDHKGQHPSLDLS